jgi:opacity protein-like surface antigen
MRRTIQAAAAALVAWSAGGAPAAKAADLSLPPVYEPEASPIVELGSGWYLRADANAYDMRYNPVIYGDLDGNLVRTNLNNTNFGATLGVGYQFNSMFRVDLTYDYMTPFSRNQGVGFVSNTNGGSLPFAQATGCPATVDPANPANLYTITCSANYTTKVTASAYLANAYIDLAHWYGITPYIGAGAGLAYVETQTKVVFRDYGGNLYGTGTSYCGGNTGLSGFSCFDMGYWNNNGPKTTQYNFAYALMAGFSYDVSSLLKLDIGYRYLNLGSSISSQEFRAGVRITPDG